MSEPAGSSGNRRVGLLLGLALIVGIGVAGWWVATQTRVVWLVRDWVDPEAGYRERIEPWQPVVAALERYVAEQGTPPAKLPDLVPQYLPAAELPALPGANYSPQPYEVTGTEYRLIISAGGWKDYLTYESDRPGWYYFDDSNAPERLVPPATGP